jgi:hypothetical protein
MAGAFLAGDLIRSLPPTDDILLPRLARYAGTRSAYLTACHVVSSSRVVGCLVPAVGDVPDVAEARAEGAEAGMMPFVVPDRSA